jgi:apyrase
MATAGLRMLPRNQSAVLLQSCRGILKASGFKFKNSWARVLPGPLEGMYAWAAVNYISGALQVCETYQLHSAII